MPVLSYVDDISLLAPLCSGVKVMPMMEEENAQMTHLQITVYVNASSAAYNNI